MIMIWLAWKTICLAGVWKAWIDNMWLVSWIWSIENGRRSIAETIRLVCGVTASHTPLGLVELYHLRQHLRQEVFQTCLLQASDLLWVSLVYQ